MQVWFALNTSVEPSAISAPEITAVVEAWKPGAISRDTMLEYFKRRKLLPDCRTAAQERAIINKC